MAIVNQNITTGNNPNKTSNKKKKLALFVTVKVSKRSAKMTGFFPCKPIRAMEFQGETSLN